MDIVDAPVETRGTILERLSSEQRLQVEELLHADLASRGFFESVVTRTAQQVCGQAFPALGDRVDAYRITGKLGQGGMGIVYSADRVDGQFDQHVAIKVIGDAAGSPLPRFDRERRILAQLSHPNIARLLDGGSTEYGSPYFVMELVEGARTIDCYCAEQRLNTRQTIELFLPVCRAIEYVHQSLAVHGDLKPGNILVDTAGHPKLVDFGIARVLRGPRQEAEQTRTSAVTLSYASPEQILGEPLTTATDVYSLAGVLYFVLTGSLPLDLKGLPLAAAVQAIREESPLPAGQRNSAIPHDLSVILDKALRKLPSERYPSMRAFSSDLEAFLDGRPVEARGASQWYRIGKLARRYWLPLSTAALVVLVTGGAFLSVNRAATLAEVARVQAESQRQAAESARSEAEQQRNQAHLAQQQADSMRGVAESRAIEVDRERKLAEARLDSERRFYELLTQLLDDDFFTGNKDSLRLLDHWIQTRQARLPGVPAADDTRRLLGFLHFRRCVAYVRVSLPRAESDCKSAVSELEPFMQTDLPDDLVVRSLTGSYMVLGQVYAGSGRKPEAIDIARKAVGLTAKHSVRDAAKFRSELTARSGLANIYLMAGQYDDAVRTQEEAYAIWARRPANSNLTGEQALLLPASMQRYARMLARKDPARAELQMRRAVAMMKQIASGPNAGCVELNEYADALNSSPFENLRDPAEAQLFAEKAVAICPVERKSMAMDTLAWSYFRKGDIPKAIELQKQALDLLPAGPSPERMTLQMSLSQFQKAQK